MFQPIHPGVHVKQVVTAPPQPTRIDVAAFVGIAERGPVGRVEVIEGWPQFVSTYGDFSVNAFLGYAVRGFFDNGGRRCHVLRVVAPALETETSGAQPADRASSVLTETTGMRAGAAATLVQSSTTLTQGAQPADRRSSVVAGTLGFVAGNIALLQQEGAPPAAREIVAVDAGANTITWAEALPDAFVLAQPIRVSSTARDARLVSSVAGNSVTWTRPLDGRFDLGRVIYVGSGAGVAGGVFYDEAGDPLLTVEAQDPGQWGNLLSVRATTRFAGDYTTRLLSAPDPNDRLSLDRVEGLRAGSLVVITQDGAVPLSTRLTGVDATDLQVRLADTLDSFDLAGSADGTKPILLRRRSVTLSVREAGRLIETHEDLDLPRPDKPAESALNLRSRTVRIALLPGASDRWIDPAAPLLDKGELRLDGGRDGIAMLSAADFTGTVGRPPAGLALFEDRPEPAAVAMPDILLPAIAARETLPETPPEPDPCNLCPDPFDLPPPPVAAAPIVEATPGFPQATVEAIQRAMVEHCEARADRVALLDPPLAPGEACVDWPDLMRWRQRFESSFAVTYHPWIDVTDPLDKAGRLVRRVPPSGHALGQFARADFAAGHAAPANRPLVWTAATACPVDDTLHAMLNERGINAITARSGRGIRIMGARTLSSSPDWAQLTVRRLVIRLKRAFRRELAWAVFEPANRAFENRVVATLESLLELEWQAGRLLGARPEEAYRVGIDRETVSAENGEFAAVVAIAPSMPAEFVFLRLNFTLDALNFAELTASGGVFA
ncbi:MAG: phage tail sheath subtilisin-like domain-containing protein [Rhodobacter sp.]|nr:phage tail sheath subtilisin-like domain-containing protein [Rhodobacter sp.]